jgi:hypothetical protein
MLESDGLGHTLGIHAKDERVLDAFFLEKPANRIVVNGPCSQGAVGYSTNLVASFSLGCGPQAGNITSDNISARHLINVKRVAFPRRDWADIERRDHARVAALTKDGMPRGSGMSGDPALTGAAPRASSSAFTPDASSNWRGNPAISAAPAASAASSSTTATTASAWSSKVGAGTKSAPPTFVSPGASATATLPRVSEMLPRASAPAAPSATTTSRSGIRQGSGLSTSEIQSLLSHAGAGCPLGPCKGCAHHEVTTGSCKA